MEAVKPDVNAGSFGGIARRRCSVVAYQVLKADRFELPTLFNPGKTYHLQSNVFDMNKDFLKIYNRGVEVGSLHYLVEQIPNTDDLYIGKRVLSGDEGPMTGDIAEIIMYDRALSDEERSSVEAYLIAKYGL